jgi:hypothetical protein
MHALTTLYLLRAMRIAIVAISTFVVLSGPAPALAQHASVLSAPRDNVFPTPHGLRPTIEFWKNVFAVWSENEIVAHDRDDLSIVYRVVPQQKSDETAVRKSNEKEQKAIKAHIRDILLDLAERNPDPRTLASESPTRKSRKRSRRTFVISCSTWPKETPIRARSLASIAMSTTPSGPVRVRSGGGKRRIESASSAG